MNGRILALSLAAATVLFVVLGTAFPLPSAKIQAGGGGLMHDTSTSEAALRSFANAIHANSWATAYDSLANKAQFSQPKFMADLMGYYPNLRTYSGLDTYEVIPVHASDNDAEYQVKFHWATVVGDAVET